MATTTDRLILNALKSAIPRLSKYKNDGKQCSICFAIPSYTPGEYAAMDMIQARLGNCCMVPAWLSRVAKIPRHQLTYRNVQAYRHRWLAALIEEFAAKCS